MYLATLQIYVLKCLDDPAYFLPAQGSAWKAALKKSKVQLHLSTDKNMSIMVEKGIRRGTYDALHQYA